MTAFYQSWELLQRNHYENLGGWGVLESPPPQKKTTHSCNSTTDPSIITATDRAQDKNTFQTDAYLILFSLSTPISSKTAPVVQFLCQSWLKKGFCWCSLKFSTSPPPPPMTSVYVTPLHPTPLLYVTPLHPEPYHVTPLHPTLWL